MRLRSSVSAGAAAPTEADLADRPNLVPLGTLLTNAGVIDEAQLAAIIDRQQRTGRLFGEVAVEMGLVSREDIQRAVAEQQHFLLLSPGDPRLDPIVVAGFDPHDVVAQAANEIRRKIATSARTDGRRIQSLVMLGVDTPTETSVLSANLAVCFAQAGYRTLLVDANLADPQMQGLFRVPNRTGVSSMLSRATPVAEHVQPTAFDNLSLITSGPDVPNASALFDKVRLFRRLASVSDRYDIILVDAGGSAPDGVTIFDGADGALIAVRRHSSSTTVFRRMVERLENVGVGTLGSIYVE